MYLPIAHLPYITPLHSAYYVHLISPGITVVPREIEDNPYAIFLEGGGGWYKQGVLWEIFS